MFNKNKIEEPVDKTEKEQNLCAIWKTLFDLDPIGLHKRIRRFTQKLKIKYPNFVDYFSYNILIGGIVSPDWEYKHFDFPGEDSVEKFIMDWKKDMDVDQFDKDKKNEAAT